MLNWNYKGKNRVEGKNGTKTRDDDYVINYFKD